MSDESVEQIERQIAGMPLCRAPQAFRTAVLADVHRELRAARWDRRLARAAVVLLVVGLGMNAAVGWQSATSLGDRPAVAAQFNPRQSLVDTAVVVAEATDAKTGRQFARQLAAMTGHTLTVEEAAAIDAAVGTSPRETLEEKKG